MENVHAARVRCAAMSPVSVRSIGGSVLAVLTTLALAMPAHARPRREASPISRAPAAPLAIVAPDTDTIPSDLVVPEAVVVDAPAAPTGATRVVTDDTEYVLDTSSSEALDRDVLAAASAESIDPRRVQRMHRRFLAAGAPVLALGLAGMLGGTLLGRFERETEIDTAAWVSIMLGGAALVAVGLPLTVRGVVLGREARAGVAREASMARLLPTFARTRGGTWTGGLVARF